MPGRADTSSVSFPGFRWKPSGTRSFLHFQNPRQASCASVLIASAGCTESSPIRQKDPLNVWYGKKDYIMEYESGTAMNLRSFRGTS